MVDLAKPIHLAIATSILLMVFSLGMRATLSDATSFFRNLFQPPRRLIRATLAMNVVVPAIAATAVALLNMPRAANVALIAVAVSPVPPILPGKQMKFGGRASYVFGLMVAVSLTSIVLAPLAIRVMGAIFQIDTHFGVGDIAKLVLRQFSLPLLSACWSDSWRPTWLNGLGLPSRVLPTYFFSLVFCRCSTLLGRAFRLLLGMERCW